MVGNLTVGSLFAGIGGFDLGFERAGLRVLWQCELDPFCREVLAQHWPGVPCHPDVRALVADAGGAGHEQDLRGAHGGQGEDAGRREPQDADVADGDGQGGPGGRLLPVPVPYVDVLCGGFPCQDISIAGKGAGITGERSGLWFEFARLIREIRPRYVVVENVPTLLRRGLWQVLADLSACGYDAEWDCLPASAFGAPHRRDRVWVVAYPHTDGRRREVLGQPEPAGVGRGAGDQPDRLREAGSAGAVQVADADGAGLGERWWWEPVRAQLPAAERGGEALADAEVDGERTGLRASRPTSERGRRPGDGGGTGEVVPDVGARRSATEASAEHWLVEPDVGRVADGVPARVDRLRALGNALVPQIAQWIGEAILAYEEEEGGTGVGDVDRDQPRAA